MEVFFCEEDYRAYIELVAQWCGRCGVEVWAYCLMPNHVHLICVPASQESLARAIGEAHRRYTRRINFREGWRGHLWQGRFGSCALDDVHLLMAARYVELNPVRAKLVRKPWRYPWSSARAHAEGRDDALVRSAPLLERVEDWKEFVCEPLAADELERFRQHERTGRPLGADRFVRRLERALERTLRRKKPGPKAKRN